jgi:branched-chain amino acid transport system ATP-binding protein
MLLDVAGLHAGYRGVTVVRDLYLQVGEGEIVALLGPNGAGKTTTLLTIAGHLPPIAGTTSYVHAAGPRQAAFKLARAGLAFIAEDRGLIGSLTVAENLALVRRARRDPYQMFPELDRLRNRRAGLLSGGEQQMLALARAFAREPQLLLVDELSQGLAPMIVHRLLAALTEAKREWGAGIVLVEQNVADALGVADRGYVLTHGRVAISDRPARELLTDRALLESSYLGAAVASGEHT